MLFRSSVLKILDDAGSVTFTKGVLDELYEKMNQELTKVEERLGRQN